MICGGGMIARAMPDRPGAVIYAAGVSDSGCCNASEFHRERRRLEASLLLPGAFVYFSSCAVYDAGAWRSPYLIHKLEMEGLTIIRGNSLVCRLPIVAGRNGNPANLLAMLRRRILLGEEITLWTKATRNIVDVREVGRTVGWLLDQGARGVVNIASSAMHSMREIVEAFEAVLGFKAKVWEEKCGERWTIPADRITLREGSGGLRRMIEDHYL